MFNREIKKVTFESQSLKEVIVKKHELKKKKTKQKMPLATPSVQLGFSRHLLQMVEFKG